MLTLALRNLFRHRVRTAVTLAAIIFGVMGLVLSAGFVQDIFNKLGEALIHSQSGHLQVSKMGFQTQGTRKPEEYQIADPERLKAQIRALPEVDSTMARVDFSGLLNNGHTDWAIQGEGIEPAPEARLGTSMRLVAGHPLRPSDTNGALIGAGVAKALHLAPGDAVTLVVTTADGAANTIDLVVTGIFQTFSKDYDARIVKIPLRSAQEVLDRQAVNVIVVSLKHTPDTARVAQMLRAKLGKDGLEVTTWQALNEFYEKTVTLYNRQFGVLRLVVLAMVLLSVANSVNMSLFERTAEFGTMRALGNRSRTVFMLIVTETLLLGVIGAAIGVALGVGLALLISAIGIPMPPPPNADVGYIAQIDLKAWPVAQAFLIGAVATLVAGIGAAVRASRVNIVDALREAI